ncbi:hypothetical protein Q0F98_30515 [Paenibacillus amylolyticus]|nr:hypothetical protein Q0F98_30515 [Paenibacillus amylolyticus]
MLAASTLHAKKSGKSFPGLAKGLWIVVIAIVLSYSYMTDKFMYVAKWGASGINAVSYVQNASSCTFNVLKTGETRATCDLTLKITAEIPYPPCYCLISHVVISLRTIHYWKPCSLSN